MEELFQNNLFHLVFGILAAIFLLSALVNAIRSRIRNNHRETARLIKDNGNTGNECAPVRLGNPCAAMEPTATAPAPVPRTAQTPVPASATVVATDKPADQAVKAPVNDNEEYVWR